MTPKEKLILIVCIILSAILSSSLLWCVMRFVAGVL